MTKRIVLLFCALLVGSLHSFAQAGGVAGEWRGVWTDVVGSVYSAEMTLQSGSSCKSCTATGTGSVRGKIVWTLRRAGKNNPADYANKVGMTGTEYVSGQMRGGVLALNGYQKDDPNAILALDKYRLVLSDNGQVIGGITYNNGLWMGQFIAKSVQPEVVPHPQ